MPKAQTAASKLLAANGTASAAFVEFDAGMKFSRQSDHRRRKDGADDTDAAGGRRTR